MLFFQLDGLLNFIEISLEFILVAPVKQLPNDSLVPHIKSGGLICKILCRNHPKFNLMIISQICIRVIRRMNVRTENTHMPLFQMWNLVILNWMASAFYISKRSTYAYAHSKIKSVRTHFIKEAPFIYIVHMIENSADCCLCRRVLFCCLIILFFVAWASLICSLLFILNMSICTLVIIVV